MLRPSTRNKTPKHAPWSWTDSIPSWTWPEAVDGSIEVEVYSDAEEVELLVNGTSQGRRGAGPSNRSRARFVVDYAPGKIEALAIRAGAPSERTSLLSASTQRRLIAIADRTRLQDDPDELAFVSVEIVDENGTRASDESCEVTLDVRGAGRQQGFGSGSPFTTGSYTDDRHELFDGKALAVIRPTGPGDIIVTARAEGFEEASVTLVVE